MSELEHRPSRSRAPRIVGWAAGALTMLVLGPIAFAVVMLDSRPGGGGADLAAKIIVALVVIAVAAAIGLLARGLTAALLRLIR